MQVDGQADLFEVVGTAQATRGLAGRLHGRQQQADQDRDDGNHHQQLDQRETGAKHSDRVAKHRALPRATGAK